MYKLSEIYPLKRAFITGAASGLGKTLCLELARDGWTIGICDLDPEKLALTKREIEGAGGRAIDFSLDVADKDKYEQVANEFISRTKGIDLLINNAGVGDGSPFEEFSLENWKWLLDINQMGVIYGCYYFVPVMKKQQSGQIINISSIASFMNTGNMSAYSMSKAAVLSLSETLFAELKDYNVKISVVMPAFFKSGIMQHSRNNNEGMAVANYMIELSNLPVLKLAQNVLKLSAQGKFYILMPFQSKVLFLLKRLFPSLILLLNAKIFKNMDKVKLRLQKQVIKKTGRDTSTVSLEKSLFPENSREESPPEKVL